MDNGHGIKVDKKLSILEQIFKCAQEHAIRLAKDQENKINSITKMLVEVVLSKLELKSLFISEYEKLIGK